MSDTPRTEDVHYACASEPDDVHRYMSMRDHACTLERENAALKNAKELNDWRTWGVVEIASRNASVAEYCRHWETRVEKAEIALAEARNELATIRSEQQLLAEAQRDAGRYRWLKENSNWSESEYPGDIDAEIDAAIEAEAVKERSRP